MPTIFSKIYTSYIVVEGRKKTVHRTTRFVIRRRCFGGQPIGYLFISISLCLRLRVSRTSVPRSCRGRCVIYRREFSAEQTEKKKIIIIIIYYYCCWVFVRARPSGREMFRHGQPLVDTLRKPFTRSFIPKPKVYYSNTRQRSYSVLTRRRSLLSNTEILDIHLSTISQDILRALISNEI